MPKGTKNQAPRHLRAATKAFWRQVLNNYELEPHHVHILTAACESWDRAIEAREAVTTLGCFFTNRHGEIKPHPGLSVERDSRSLFAKLIRELNLDVDSPTEEYSRPPQLRGGR